MEAWQKRIGQIRESRPIYRELLDLYQKVREEQERMRDSSRGEFIPSKKEGRARLTEGDLPLFQKQDFPLDLDACVHLFQSICQIAEDANPFMAEQTRKIEETIKRRKLNLKKLLRDGLNDQKAARAAKRFEWDQNVFSFLIQNSVKPSVEAEMKHVSKDLAPETWLKGNCPVCGSLPHLALLGEEIGKRSLLCSFCGYRWGIERFFCPFCNNQEQDSLHYFYAENEESYRIDTCEKCHQYIKTIDLRKMEVPDASLEDLATLHLDILASQKGYGRPVPTLLF